MIVMGLVTIVFRKMIERIKKVFFRILTNY